MFCPCRIRIGCGAETTSEESSQPQIGKGKACRIGRKSEGIRRGLKIKGVPGILWQTEIGRAEARKHGRCVCCYTRVFGVRIRPVRRLWGGGSRPAVQMARVAIPFAAKQFVPGLLVCSHGVVACQEGVELRREGADRQA